MYNSGCPAKRIRGLDGASQRSPPEENDQKFNERYAHWKDRSEAVFGTAEVIIAKQRHGPIGTVKLHFEAETTKFDNFIGPERLPSTVY